MIGVGAILTKPMLIGAVSICVVLSAALGVQTLRLAWAQKAEQECRADFAEAKQKAEEARAKQEQAFRQKEQNWQDQISNARNDFETARRERDEVQQQITQTEARIVRLRVDRDKLHNQLIEFAAVSGSATEDSLTSCRTDAGRLGKALAESTDIIARGGDLVFRGLTVARESAAAAEERGTKLVLCLKAWPKN
jgi:membrane-bound lytic murein transglycosylase